MSGALSWLRDKHGDSNHLSLEIPIKLCNNAKGAKHIVVDRSRIRYFLELTHTDVDNLAVAELTEQERPPTQSIKHINYVELAQEYGRRLESGEFHSRSVLARNLGVSRAWISKVMKRGSVVTHPEH